MTKQPSRRRRLSPEARKKELLATALLVAADRGLSNLVHADVARSSGVAIATVFLYFPDSRSLVHAVVEEVSNFYRAQCDECLKQQTRTPDDLMDFAYAFVDSIDSHPNHAAVFLQWAAAIGNEHGIWDLFLDHMGYMERRVRRSARTLPLQRGTRGEHPANTFSRLYLAGAFVAIRLKFAGASRKTLRRHVNQSMALLLH